MQESGINSDAVRRHSGGGKWEMKMPGAASSPSPSQTENNHPAHELYETQSQTTTLTCKKVKPSGLKDLFASTVQLTLR
jgi:hypothetical protein